MDIEKDLLKFKTEIAESNFVIVASLRLEVDLKVDVNKTLRLTVDPKSHTVVGGFLCVSEPDKCDSSLRRSIFFGLDYVKLLKELQGLPECKAILDNGFSYDSVEWLFKVINICLSNDVLKLSAEVDDAPLKRVIDFVLNSPGMTTELFNSAIEQGGSSLPTIVQDKLGFVLMPIPHPIEMEKGIDHIIKLDEEALGIISDKFKIEISVAITTAFDV